MISCLGCGQSLRFEPKSQRLVCDYCGNNYDPTELKSGKTAQAQADYNDESQVEEASVNDTFEGTLFTCPQCGGEILSDRDTAITFCSYCGSSIELTGRTVKMKAPSFVIPFKKAKDECQGLYRSFMKKALFAPNYMQTDTQIEKLRGIYMPYWIYEFDCNGNVGLDGKTSHRSGDYIVTDYYRINAGVRSYYKGVSFDASSSYSDAYSQSIAPYNISECEDFNAGFLSGFYADTADVNAKLYNLQAREVVGEDIARYILAQNPQLKSHYNVSLNEQNISGLINTRDEKLAYFPVWFMSTRHKDGISYAVINGQTGKIAADVPIDYTKYLIGSAILALPIMLILDLLFTIRPSALTVIALIFAVISLFISNSELDLIYTRNRGFDDRGLLSSYGATLPEEIEAQIKETKKKTKPANVKSVFSKGISVCSGIAFFFLMLALEAEEAFLLLGTLIFGLFAGIFFICEAVTKNKLSPHDKSAVFKQPFSEKLPVVSKPLIAMGIGVLFLIINPYQDILYYSIVLVIMGLVLVSFYDIVKLHNKLTRRLPRQFNKRGGDE